MFSDESKRLQTFRIDPRNGAVLKKKPLICSGEYAGCRIHQRTVSAKSQMMWFSRNSLGTS